MTEVPTAAPKGWSRWGEWLTAIVAVGTAAALAGAWAIQYFDSEGNARLIERVTYIVEDRSWMPPGASPLQPLLGLHYFGDLAIVLGYGEVLNPYIIPGMPAQYPPVAIFVFKLLGAFGQPMALVILVALSLTLLPCAVWALMRGLSIPQKILTIVVLVYVTIPMISTLDRGGLQFIAIGVLALAILAYTRNHEVIAIVLFVVAVSLKSYLLLFALYPLVRGYKWFAIKCLATAVALNGVLFLAFPGRPTVSFGGFLTSTVFFSTTDMVVDGNSLSSLPLRIVEMLQGTEAASALLSSYALQLSILTLLWLSAVVWLISRPEVPYWVSLSLILSSATMVVGAAYPYNYVWASLAAFYFGARGSDPFPIQQPVRGGDRDKLNGRQGLALGVHGLRILTLVTIAVALVPQFWIWDGPSGDGRRAISLLPPIAVVTLTCAAAAYWVRVALMGRRDSLQIHA